MSEKNAPGHDSGSEALTEAPEAPAVPEVAGTPVRPELRLEVIAAPTGQFGAADAGDTTGYGEHPSVRPLHPPATTRVSSSCASARTCTDVWPWKQQSSPPA